MDVVNETIINGAWHQNKPGTVSWECPWFIIGQDTDANTTPLYIKLAFETAKAYAPNIKFIFNHHEPPSRVNSWNLIKDTILYLRNKNLRVDGIGWQAHVEVGAELDQNYMQKFRELITWAHQNNLEFHITEASV
jgi:GH35 family endo-1,4-beta-xylanase